MPPCMPQGPVGRRTQKTRTAQGPLGARSPGARTCLPVRDPRDTAFAGRRTLPGHSMLEQGARLGPQ